MKSETPLLRRAADYLTPRVLPLATRMVTGVSAVGTGTFFSDRKVFPWIASLEGAWRTIRDEMEQVKRTQSIPGLHEITPVLEYLAGDNGWRTFFLVANGEKIVGNCRSCPKTVALLDQVPGLNSAFFSILRPGKHIPAHHGVYNGLLRYHLGLRVPRDPRPCRIRVGQDIRYWEEGKSLLFDDCHEHEVWNDTEEERVVLIADVLRPMAFPFSTLNKMVVNLTSQTTFAWEAIQNIDALHQKGTAAS